MNRRLVLIATAGLLVTAGCKKDSKKDAPTGVKVGLLLPDAADPYYQAVRRAVDRVATERGYEVIAGDVDASSQAAALERMSEQGAKVVLVDAADQESMGPAVEAAVSKNVFAVLMERPMEDADVSSTVVFNHELAGQLLADFLGSELKTGGNVGLLAGGGTPGEKKRTQAFRDYLKEKFPTIKIAAEGAAKADELGPVAKKLIAGKKLDAVVAMNPSAGAAAMAAIGTGAGKPILATYGGREALTAALKSADSPVRLVVEPLPQWLGDRAGKLAWRVVTNKPVASMVELPLQPVTRENLDTYRGWDGAIPENMAVPWTSSLTLDIKREE